MVRLSVLFATRNGSTVLRRTMDGYTQTLPPALWKLVVVVSLLLITRIIGPAGYGAYVAAMGVYSYALFLAQTGVATYLNRQAERDAEADFNTASTLLLGTSLIVVLVIESAMSLIAGWVGIAGFGPLFEVVILVLPVQCLGIPAISRLEKALDYRRVALGEISCQVAGYALMIPMTLAGYGPWGLAVSWIVQQVLGFGLWYILARRLPRFGWNREIAWKIVRYSVSYCAASGIWQLRGLVNPMIVGHSLGSEIVGQIGLTIAILEKLAFAKGIAWRLSIPALARVQDSPVKLCKAITQGMELQVLAIAPFILGFAWFGWLIIPVLFKDRWNPVMDVFPFIALSYLTNAQFSIHSSVLYVLHKNWDVFRFHVLHVMIFAVTAYLASPYLGILGYGVAELAAIASYGLLHVYVVQNIGSPDYRVSAVWWMAAVLGLFWHELGWWIIPLPFLVLLWPPSVRRLRYYFDLLWKGSP
jgi:O-antigen/teichoic acid export membrane protein